MAAAVLFQCMPRLSKRDCKLFGAGTWPIPPLRLDSTRPFPAAASPGFAPGCRKAEGQTTRCASLGPPLEALAGAVDAGYYGDRVSTTRLLLSSGLPWSIMAPRPMAGE